MGGDTTCSRSTTKSSRTRSGHRYERRHGRTDWISFCVFELARALRLSRLPALTSVDLSGFTLPDMRSLCSLCKRTRNLLVCGCSLAHPRGLVRRRGAWKLPCLSVHFNPSRPAGRRLAFFFGFSRARSAYQCRSVGVHPARHAITLLSCKRTRNLLVCGCSLAHSRGLVCRRGAWKLPCLSVHMNPAQAPV